MLTGRYIFDRERREWIKVDDSARLPGSAYFREPYFESQFADSKNPEGQWVESKGQKSQIMKSLGIVESGDRVRGARL